MAILTNNRNYSLINSVRTLPSLAYLNYIINTDKVRLISTYTTSNIVSLYEFRYGTTWETSTLIGTSISGIYDWPSVPPSTYQVWVSATDLYGNISISLPTTINISVPGVFSLYGKVSGADIKLDWSIPTTTFTIDSYEIRYSNIGGTWATATTIGNSSTSGTTKATTFITPAVYNGSKLWWVAAKDSLGNYSVATSVTITIDIPASVTGIKIDVVDNNALLYWNPSTVSVSQLPIDQYEVRKGASYASSVLVGSNANSTFSSIFEQSYGTYTYWVTPLDTSGNYGIPSNISTTINQPPDYVLNNNYNSMLDGTFTGFPNVINPTSRYTNFYIEAGKLLGPVDTSEVWNTHYTNNSKTTPADFGDVLYISPSAISGTYEEVLDYGSILPSTVVTVTPSIVIVTGTVNTSVTISHKSALGDSWTVITAGQSSVLLPAFRYVRVTVTYSTNVANNLCYISGLNVKLSVKQRNDSGIGIAAIGGTVVNFGYPFISADTPIVQPSSSTAQIPVVIYTGSINPTGFTVKIYNLSGTEVGGPFSWVVRGY